tara:strand:- start:2515 stop:3312 length:798 start_codon:yes stop_codon:yes gene_type:complete
MSQISKYNITNTDNYNNTFNQNANTIFTKYMLLINEYMKQTLDNIFIQNQIYNSYVIKRGINTINTVFKTLLLYTKNLDMTYYNSQKSYIYYIEFIGQIGDDNHSFLQLNSKDASLFVYKKTIFEINNDNRKNFSLDESSTIIMNDINEFILIYNTLLFKLLDNHKLIDVIKYLNTDVQFIMNKLIKMYLDSNIINTREKINAIYIFSIYFKNDNLFDCLDIFIKKIKKKNKINIKLLQLYLIDEEFYDITPVKYINSLIQNITN